MSDNLRRFLVLAALLPLVLGGCGDSGDDDAEPIQGDTFALVIHDFEFRPKELKLEPGATVTAELANEGDTTHSFTIDELDVDEELEAGARKDVDFEVPEGIGSKDITYYCRFHPQMKGTIEPV